MRDSLRAVRHSTTMDVKAFLKKQGWVPGKGLGKNENGIATCIKAQPRRNRSPRDFESITPWADMFDRAASTLHVLDGSEKPKFEVLTNVAETPLYSGMFVKAKPRKMSHREARRATKEKRKQERDVASALKRKKRATVKL